MKMIQPLLVLVALLSLNCTKSTDVNNCIKGKLIINGICGNITIQVLSGPIDSNLIVKSWQDPSTSKTYENVFALKSICTFPSSIKEGDEFYFKIDNDPKGSDCAVCLAYRPTPPKGLMISICK
jgi:hypothetical protein